MGEVTIVVTIMTILTINGTYNVVIWTTESCSCSQSQMAFMIIFVVVNVVVNAMFWHCVFPNILGIFL